MNFTKNTIWRFCALVAVVILCSNVYAEESLYVISNMDIGELKAYEIDGNSLIFQATGSTNHGDAVGITVHDSNYGKELFCSFENYNKIKFINAQTMVSDGEITVSGAYNPAGIVIDNSKSKLYVIDRGTNKLWSYSWNPATKTLTPDFNSPYYIQLQTVTTAFGIALDEQRGMLYVGDNTDSIKYYNTADWSKADEVSVPCNAISVAVDVGNHLLYFGSMGVPGQGDPHLYQYNLSTDEIDSVIVVNSVAGIAVDQQTGFVYITTFSDSYGGDLIIFDSDLNQHGTPIWLGSPAGVCVPYNYSSRDVTLTKTDDVNADGIKPGNRLTYTIRYNYAALGQDPLTSVVLTDYLPAEVLHTNVTVTGGVTRNYDANSHTVTWTLGTLNPGTTGSVTVAVTVADVTRPTTGYLRNTAKITADEANEITVTKRTPWYYRVHNDTKNLWYRSIQSAITAADNNDVIVVYPGIYAENVNFSNKQLTLQSSEPNDPAIVAQTVIRVNSGIAVTFTNSSTINGFTIKNISSGGMGVSCNGSASAPTIKNCLIRDNSIGVFCFNLSAPTIENCIIKNNSASGINCSSAKQVKIINNLIVNNGNNGHGVYIDSTAANVIIRNNTISKNYYGIYRNNSNDPNISNCIIWNNSGGNFVGTDCNNVNYSCINSSSTGSYSGRYNITTDPCFVDDVNVGDFHLKSASLCRNAGDPNLNYDGETDIDGEPRRNGTARVDIGADEFYATTDLNADGQVNFPDYAIFANAWRTYPGNIKWNAACDFVYNNNIDINDLAWFAQDWYFPPADQPSTEPEAPAPNPSEPPPPPPTTIYLTYEGSMTPDPNTEVTVYVYSEIPLSSMDMIVTVTGDANITTAMGSYDCADYGWDSEWGWDPYIDPSGWVEFGGVSWEGVATGTVGYFKFIYNSGEVAVSIAADSYVYDANSQPAAFSTQTLTFGSGTELNAMMMATDSSIAESATIETSVDVNELADWLEQLWLEDAEIRATNTPEEWQQFIDNLRSGQYQ